LNKALFVSPWMQKSSHMGLVRVFSVNREKETKKPFLRLDDMGFQNLLTINLPPEQGDWRTKTYADNSRMEKNVKLGRAGPDFMPSHPQNKAPVG